MRVLFVILIIPLTLLLNKAIASHAVGIDLTYSCLGGNQYRFSVSLYRDCAGALAPTSLVIDLSSASCGVNSTATLNLSSSQEVSQICGSQLLNTTCGNGSLPGIEQYVYTGTFTFPSQCSDWVASYSLCCRNNGITNLQSASGFNLYVEAHINNTGGLCNSSPTFNSLPTPYLCLGQSFSYNNGAVDADGDSLVYTLVNPLDDANTNIPYNAGYTPTIPLSVSGTFNFDSNTGQMSFTPNQIQRGVISILIEEYDNNGNLVGSSMRDLQLIVINCNNTPPTASGVNGSGSIFDYTSCAGSSFCFDVTSTDINAGNNTTLTYNNGVPGASFTISGTPFQTGTFCWTPTLADVGTHYFTITVEDDACPIPGVNTYTYEIVVLGTVDPPVDAGPDQSICNGNSANLNAIAGPSAIYSWLPSTGLSCTNCQNPVASPTSSTIYTVTASYPGGCDRTDQIAVTVNPNPTATVNPTNLMICSGSSVTLAANSPTATTYSWSPGGQSAQSISVTPGSSTNYTVTVTDANGCSASATSTITVSPPPPTEVCNNIYVTTNGVGTGSSPSDPTDLASAILMSQCNNATIKMATGLYTIDNPINTILGYTTLEGGYDAGNGWRKTSAPGATTIRRSAQNPEGPANARRLGAIYMNSASYFRFQDLTIEVVDASISAQAGVSTYALHLTNCSNYDIVRCQITSGNGGNGGNGALVPGTGGAGGGGSGGSGGNGANGCGNPSSGSSGNTGNGGANGGSGSDIGSGGFCCGSSSPSTGGTGGNGGNGSGYISGNIPATPTPTGGYFVPQVATNGGNGFGGGGGGGGGGSRGGTVGCINCDGNDGGAGGAGGGGGLGGSGGYGGGASIAIFVDGGGTGSFIVDCDISSGLPGNGGIGRNGQNGSSGSSGVVPPNFGSCIGGNPSGGTGGNGGNGGRGGRGRDGANGLSTEVYNAGGSITVTQGSTNYLLVNGTNNVIDFNLPNQPEIFVENISCTNTDLDYTSSVSNTWNLGTGSTIPTPSGSTVTTQYTALGRKDIQYSANTYTGFSNITLNGVIDPDINTTALQIGIDSFVVCVGDPVDFFSTAANFSRFDWDFGGAIIPNLQSGMSLTNINFTTPGVYTITLTGFTDCCGPSNPVDLVLIVDDLPTVSVNGTLNFCEGQSTTLTATSLSDSLVWSPNLGINTDTGSVVTFNPPTTTNYLVTAYSTYRICNATNSFTVTVDELPDVTFTGVTPASCGNDGSATAQATNITNPLSYLWNDPNGQTTAQASNLFSGNYQVVVTDNITGCSDSSFTFINAGTSPIVYISSVQNVDCFGDSTGIVTAMVSNGASPFDFDWTSLPSNNSVLTENNVVSSTLSNVPAGSYTVSVNDNNNCTHTINFSIGEPDTSLYVIDSSIINATCYATNDGSIAITADGGSGGYTFLWDTNAGSSTLDSVGNLNPGIYLVDITDANGCTVTDSFTVEGPVILLNTIAGLPDSICGGDYVLQAVPTMGNTSGEWLPALTTGPGIASFASLTDPNSNVNIGTNYGTYTFFWTEDNGAGCPDTASVDILFDVPPLVNAGIDDTICSFSSALNGVSATSSNIWNTIVTGGTGTLSYGDPNSLTSSITVTSAGYYEIELLGVNAANCEARDTITLHFSDPSFTTTTIDENCADSDGSIMVTNVTGNFGTPTYSNDNGLNYNSSNSFTGLSAGNYGIIVMDALGCTDTNQVVVSNSGSLTVNGFTVLNPTCFGESDGDITVNATTISPPLSYKIDRGPLQSSPYFGGLSHGTYEIVTVDASLCNDTSYVQIIEPDSITFDALLTTPSCNGDCDGEIQLINLNGGAGTPYTIINPGGGNFDANGLFQNACTGVYDVTVEDVNRCSSTMTNIILNEPAPLTLSLIIDSVSCNGLSDGEVTATVAGGTPPYDYNWSGLASNNQSQAIGIPAGNYSITVTDANGCIANISNYLVEEPVPVVIDNITVIDPLCYEGSDGQITIGNAPTAVLFGIDGDSTNGIVYQNSNVFTNLNAGAYTLYAQDADGCLGSVPTMIFNSIPEVIADFTFSPEVGSIIQNEIEFINLSQGASSYLWSFGSEVIPNTSTEEHLIAVYPNTTGGTYTTCLVASNVNNCLDTACKDVIIEDQFLLYVPNSFTPNLDGVNDFFGPVIQGVNPSDYELLIFNRWGELVFSANHVDDLWNGECDNSPCQTGIYTWKITINKSVDAGYSLPYSGHLNLLR